MQEMGLHTLAADINNSLPQPASTKGKNQQTSKPIVQIRIHQSISLTTMIKEMMMMMTLKLMRSHYPWQLRCFLNLTCSAWGIIALHLNVLNLIFNI